MILPGVEDHRHRMRIHAWAFSATVVLSGGAVDDDPITVEQPIEYPPIRFRIEEGVLSLIIEEIVVGGAGSIIRGLQRIEKGFARAFIKAEFHDLDLRMIQELRRFVPSPVPKAQIASGDDGQLFDRVCECHCLRVWPKCQSGISGPT